MAREQKGTAVVSGARREKVRLNAQKDFRIVIVLQ